MTKATRLVAPEGGWGYLVCFGMAMPLVCLFGSVLAFALLFGEFFKSIEAGNSATAMVTSVFFSLVSFAGLFSNTLHKQFSLRTVGIVGAVLYFIGSLMQVYVKSTFELVIAYGVLHGTSFGLIVPTSYTIFNQYFVKKRMMMMSFCQTLVGFGVMFYPILVQKLNKNYGYRGCLLVMAAINSHAILGMVIMQPVEWHMKRVKIDDEEVENTDKERENRRLEPLINEGTRNSLNLQLNDQLSNRVASMSSLEIGPAVINEASRDVTNEKSSLWEQIVKTLDLSLLRDPVYLNIVLGMSFAVYSDVSFFTFQPMYLFELHYSSESVSQIIAIGAAADVVSRIVLGLSAIFFTVSARNIFLAGTFFTIIARFAFLEIYDFYKMAIITAIMGFLKTWINTTMPLVFAEFLPSEKFASGFGLFMFLQGNITFLVGPIVGLLRDYTKDYVATFHCFNFFMALCAVPWILEILYIKCIRKNNSKDFQNSVISN